MEIKSRVPGKIVRFEKQDGSNENETTGTFSGSRRSKRVQSTTRRPCKRRPSCCYR